ncbi:helix-turn-helix domain-containing protein [Asticcacaulis sp.]|jgi:transcriptional regulator with XRE-family HTH domain|uniref:helix-turn-helix domain-containing protein n=1 Tax=Asticcacaulis sp. TaxID=1872648 RepID=UPI003F7BCB00
MLVRRLLGWNVTRLRQSRNLTQEDLAGLIQTVDQGYLSRLENGQRNPSAEQLALIAQALGVTIGDLFSFEGAPQAYAAGPVEIKPRRRRKQI